MKRLISGSSTAVLMVLSSMAFSADNTVGIQKKTQPFSVKLGATRVIYTPQSSGATLSVMNPQDYPMLVRSRVFAEDKKTAAPFIVTPPLFRLDGQQQSRLRVVRVGEDNAKDRETLNWLCITGIPPKNDDAWAKDEKGKSQVPSNIAVLNVQVSIGSCIKLFTRPSSIKGTSEDAAASLTWKQQNGQLVANNPTPFYINLDMVSVGGNKIVKLDYVSPFSSQTFTLPKGATGEVQWQVVTDYGGNSRVFQSNYP